MKGLLKYLSPFAPDQSGAVSVLYEMGGIIVICDAGGCTGNICGFDESRWFEKKSALFSAGLRDMDAILGRDDRLVEKLDDAARHLNAKFIALVGTPVPAVIATDFRALKRMAEKKTGLPVITLECTGTHLYDRGASDAYLSLFQTFAKKDAKKDSHAVGVLGVNPLDVSMLHPDRILRKTLGDEGYARVYCYGMDSDSEKTGEKGSGFPALTMIEKAGSVAKNIVLAPSGMRAAEYLQKIYGTPYETAYPLLSEEFRRRLRSLAGKRVLIVHQQIAANEIRREIAADSAENREKIVCGTWFMQVPELKKTQDVTFEREEEFVSFVKNGAFEAIVADARFRRALQGWKGEFAECPHFAVSGTLTEEDGVL
ncbi:MAG: nitrogenase component 1 [Clostridiales bacterium]|nr:nitrogenase component 1 [Clostridiales bacterium]